MFHNFIKYLWILFIPFMSFAQNLLENDLRESQEFSYLSNFLEIKIKTDRFTFRPNDTINLELSLENLSKENVFIFLKPTIRYFISKDSLEKKITRKVLGAFSYLSIPR